MPHYDPKNIPVLDDIVESLENEERDSDLSIGSTEAPDSECDAGVYAAENNLDLFAGEAIDFSTEDTAIEAAFFETGTTTVTDTAIEYTITATAEPQIGVIDNINTEDSFIYEQTIVEHKRHPRADTGSVMQETPGEQHSAMGSEAACRDEDNDKEQITTALIDYIGIDDNDISTINIVDINEQADDQPVEIKQQTLTANAFQSITDDIVKQLMPELEQQLRLLLKQALKDALPEETSLSEMSASSDNDS